MRLLSVADYKTNETDESNPFTGSEEIITQFPDIENMEMGKERKAQLKKVYGLLNDALSNLSSKHKIIYRT